HGYFGYSIATDHAACANMRLDLVLQNIRGSRKFAAIDGKRKVSHAVMADILDNHIHIDVVVRYRAENLISNARAVRHAQYGNLGLVTIECDTRNDRAFHVPFLESNKRAL